MSALLDALKKAQGESQNNPSLGAGNSPIQPDEALPSRDQGAPRPLNHSHTYLNGTPEDGASRATKLWVMGVLSLFGVLGVFLWQNSKESDASNQLAKAESYTSQSSNNPVKTKTPSPALSEQVATVVEKHPSSEPQNKEKGLNKPVPPSASSLDKGLPSSTLPEKNSDKSNARKPAPLNKPKVELVKTAQAAHVKKDSLGHLVESGSRWYERKQYTRALQSFKKAYKQAPRDERVLNGLAETYIKLGKPERAQYYYHALSSMGASVAKVRVSATKPQPLPRSSIEPTQEQINARTWFGKGTRLAKESRWAEAQSAYFNAHRLNPKAAHYAFNLAVSLEHLGQIPSALLMYKKALKLSKDQHGVVSINVIAQRIQFLERHQVGSVK